MKLFMTYKGELMAKLSTRVSKNVTEETLDPSFCGGEALDKLAILYGVYRKTCESDKDLRIRLWDCKSKPLPLKENSIKQENNMNINNTLKEVTITLVDNNINLEDSQRIVFQKKGVQTSNSLEDTKMNVIASGEVILALGKHNQGVRAETINQDILERTGREVTLKPN